MLTRNTGQPIHYQDAGHDMPPRHARTLNETRWGELHSYNPHDCGWIWGWVYREPINLLGNAATIIRYVSMHGDPTTGHLILEDPDTHLDRSITYGEAIHNHLKDQIKELKKGEDRWDHYWPTWKPAAYWAACDQLTREQWQKRHDIVAKANETIYQRRKDRT